MPELRYVKAVNDALAEEMARDERVILLGEDIGAAGGTFGASKGLFERFGKERVRDTPISETAIVGAAIGAAANGLRPVAEIMFMDFLGTCWDQIVNQMAKMHYMFGGQVRLPLVIRTHVGAGLNAGPQHSGSLEAWAVHVPGLKVVMPSTPADAKGLPRIEIARGHRTPDREPARRDQCRGAARCIRSRVGGRVRRRRLRAYDGQLRCAVLRDDEVQVAEQLGKGGDRFLEPEPDGQRIHDLDRGDPGEVAPQVRGDLGIRDRRT